MNEEQVAPIKARGGRPKVKLDLPDGWQNTILGLYREGASDTEIKAWIIENRPSGTFSNDLWERWLEDEPPFSEAVKTGRMLAHSWWEMKGRTNLSAQHFQPGLYTLNMANRYGWNSSKNESRLDAGEQLVSFLKNVVASGDGKTRGLPEKP